MLVIGYATLPGLDSVTVWAALVVFTNCTFGKTTAVGDIDATDCVPTPLSEMFNDGVTGSLLVMIRTVLRLPIAVGLKLRAMTQLSPAPRPVPPMGQPLPTMKSTALPPLAVTPPITNPALPVFVIVSV